MRAQKFYDKEGVGYELFMDYEKESIMLIVDDQEKSGEQQGRGIWRPRSGRPYHRAG
jgi:hypothetical protein